MNPSGSPGAPEPPGLQRERTILARHRTMLSLVGGAAAITRLSYGELGLYSLACLGASLVCVAWLLRRHASLSTASATLALTVMTVVAGVTELLALVWR